MKKQSGITLIALVITIIVLLILAGVSISAITGENGIVDKARDAAEKTEEAEKEEQDTLKGYEEMIDSSLEDVKIIKFTICSWDNTVKEYEAEEKMTFGEWIESEYNVDGYRYPSDGGFVILNSTEEYWITISESGGDRVESSYEIVGNHQYYLHVWGQGDIL